MPSSNGVSPGRPAGPYLAAPVGVPFPAGPESGLADVRLFTLVIAPDRAVLTVSGRLSDENLRSRHLDPWPLFGGHPPVAVDDRGNRYQFHEDSGWSDDENWAASCSSPRSRPAGIRWLELTMVPGSAPVRVKIAGPGPEDEGSDGPGSGGQPGRSHDRRGGAGSPLTVRPATATSSSGRTCPAQPTSWSRWTPSARWSRPAARWAAWSPWPGGSA